MGAIDQLLDQRLSFGLYQKRLLFLAFTAYILLGTIQVSIAIAAQVITQDQFLDTWHTSVLVSISPAASLIGSFTIGYLADVIGRHRMILTIYFIVACAIASLIVFDNFFIIVSALVVCCFYNSCTINVVLAYVGEIVPTKIRGKTQTYLTGMSGIGRLAASGICALAFMNYRFGYWKIPFFVVGSIISVIWGGLLIWIRPSLHQKFKSGDHVGLVRTFKEIQQTNLGVEAAVGQDTLSKTEIEIAHAQDTEDTCQKGKFHQIFGKGNRRKTFVLLLERTVLSILFAGDTSVAPKIFGTNNAGLILITLIPLGEFAGTIICALLIDRLGQRRTLIISEMVIFATLIAQMFVPEHLDWTIALNAALIFTRRAFVKTGFTCIEILFTGSYEANLRTTVFGMSMTLSGTIVTLTNMSIFFLYYKSPAYLFGTWALYIGVSIIVGLAFPSKKLEQVHDSKTKNLL
jgi:MFS family permease